MSIVEEYLQGLSQRLSASQRQALARARGASDEDVARLRARYPECPAALIELLRRVDGTYSTGATMVISPCAC